MNKKTLSSIIIVLLANYILLAQNGSPVNSNYLIEHGVSPRVLDAAANSLLQDGSFESLVTIIKNENDETKEVEFSIIYDPEYKYGMDIRVVLNTDSIGKKDIKVLKKLIESNHQFSRMSRHYLYDESTLKMIKNEGNEVVIEYFYQKNDIEPYLQVIKRLKGEIYFIDGKLDKVVLTNIKPLKNKVVQYEKTVRFSKTDKGGYIIAYLETRATINKGNKKTNYTLKSTTINYFNKENKSLSWSEKNEVKLDKIVSPDTISVGLGWKLPFLGKPATKLGYSLPRPVGINIFSHYQLQNMQFTDLSISVDDSKFVSLGDYLDLENSSVDQYTSIVMVKGDVWVFPFLNIMGIFGKGENNVNGDLGINPELVEAIKKYGWLVGIDPDDVPESIPFNTTINSVTYGGGVTLAGGVGDWNLSVNYQLVFSKLTEVNTTNMANVITPMVGYMTPFGLNVMAGAQGQFYKTAIQGFIEFNDDNGAHKLNYNVDFEPARWNLMFGLYKGFNKHWEIALQAGIGARSSATAVFGYRF